MIPITTPKSSFRVWTKRVGNNPRIKVLLLYGGPGATHELWEAVDSYFPGAGIEYYYYDQLGSAFSDQPADTDLWTTERFVGEVEQVRQALAEVLALEAKKDFANPRYEELPMQHYHLDHKRPVGGVGSLRGPGEDQGADARDRCPTRHDGPGDV